MGASQAVRRPKELWATIRRGARSGEPLAANELQAEENGSIASGRAEKRRGPMVALSVGWDQGRERMVEGRAAWMALQKMKGRRWGRSHGRRRRGAEELQVEEKGPLRAVGQRRGGALWWHHWWGWAREERGRWRGRWRGWCCRRRRDGDGGGAAGCGGEAQRSCRQRRRGIAGGRAEKRKGPMVASMEGLGQGRERTAEGWATWTVLQKMKGR